MQTAKYSDLYRLHGQTSLIQILVDFVYNVLIQSQILITRPLPNMNGT